MTSIQNKQSIAESFIAISCEKHLKIKYLMLTDVITKYNS